MQIKNNLAAQRADALFFVDIALNVAADLMIRDCERRCRRLGLRFRVNSGSEAAAVPS
jgi:hypothetical protein